VFLNPLSYLIEAFRFALIGLRVTPVWYDLIFLTASATLAAVAGSFFRRMSPVFSDYE
jgi:ABC-type polysaccharide/polyol phosphate export permease